MNLAVFVAVACLALTRPAWMQMRWLKLRYCFYAIVAVVAVVTLLIAIEDALSPKGAHYVQVMSFGGAMLVATGWIVTNEVSIRNSRRQHTITLISDYMIRKERIEDKQTIRKHLPGGASITTLADLSYEDENHVLIQAIDRELNFYEFIAVGLENGDLDPRIASSTVRSLLVGFVGQTRPYIDFWQARDREIWEYAVRLADKWARDRAPRAS